jgi:hypothetical protein
MTLRTLFWTTALVCLLVVMAPTLRQAARCARRAPTFGAWTSCLERGLTPPFGGCYAPEHDPLRRGAQGSVRGRHD